MSSEASARPRGRRSNAALRDSRPARDRLLDAANELFYAGGIQSVGIDRVIEHAGVAKGSLYNIFGSKEALVHAYLESRRAGIAGLLTAAIAEATTPREKLLAVFDTQGQLFTQCDFHGCAFIAASVDAPAGGSVDRDVNDYRAWIRTLFIRLAKDAGARDPAVLARQLQLLYDGAAIAADIDHDPTITTSVRAAAAALLDAASDT